jgi:2-amino-4-hydroxy-6-hydroxymethyldihydropteridine diphosphokinase
VKTAYLSLGSNLGDRQKALQDAIRLLETTDLSVRRVSSVYETEPRDAPDQPWFLNLVIEVETGLNPEQLLRRAVAIETELGRERTSRHGPRTIDIDILLYEDLIIDTAELVVPHPRMAERRFVLEPLAELAPDLRHPVLGSTARELMTATIAQRGRRR